MEAALRHETELRLLMTAAATEDEQLRQRILDFPHFTGKAAQNIQAAFIEKYLIDPAADYSVLVSSLRRDDALAMIEMMNTAISQEVSEHSADGVMAALERDAAEQKLHDKLIDLLASGTLSPDDLRQAADEAEPKTQPTSSLDRYIDEYDTPVKVVPTGYGVLDGLLGGGLAAGTVSSLGARPSVGKTAMAVNIAAANCDKNVLIFSLEMSARMIYDKIISQAANIDYRDCVRHRINMDTVRTTLSKFENITVIDDIYDAETMAQMIRHTKPDLAIIDYIQIVQTKERIDIIRQRIDRISQILKRTAKATGTHIMCLSQLTRGASEEPTMAALKESGGLEETSDYILLLKRPYVLNKTDERYKPEETELKVDKNKFGESGVLEFYFEGKYQRFYEIGFLSEKKSRKATQSTAHMKQNSESIGGKDLPF